MGAFIEMVGISKVYSQGNSVTKALDNLSLAVKEGAFLSFPLLPMLDAKRNVELTAMISGMGKTERRRRVVELIKKVGSEIFKPVEK